MRKDGTEPSLRSDPKSQLSVIYGDSAPVGVCSIVLSTHHASESQISDDIRAIVEPYICEVLPAGGITEVTEWRVNPTGTFVVGGPDGEAGFTGRKIIVDTYGGGHMAAGIFWQRSDQSRSIGGLCGALSGEKCCFSWDG